MAYVRSRGNQLLIVRGERAPGTKNVQQRILATIYSRPEARAILGRGADGDAARRFRSLLEHRHAGVRFDWKKIHKAIAAHLEVLPEDYAYEGSRLQGRFRDDLCTFLRQLAITDPQELATSAEVIRAHRHELAFLAELVAWRLRTCDTTPSEWTADDQFGWRFATRGYGRGIPTEIEEMAIGLYERNEHDPAAAVFRLLIDTFPDYADGHNYLGLIELDRGDRVAAISHFERTIEVGRRLFPARLAKKHYWSDLDTRPYMRGLRNLALVLNQVGRYDDAERACARLADECGDDLTADYHRAAIAMNRGRWIDALNAAARLVELYPELDFIVAAAALELGRADRVLPAFLHAALCLPRAAHLFFGRARKDAPRARDDVRDHNAGVSLRANLHAYLTQRSRRATRYFRALLDDPRLAHLLESVIAARARRERQRASDEREAFDYLHRVQGSQFAASHAATLADLAPGSARSATLH